jgi:hypothetical protein
MFGPIPTYDPLAVIDDTPPPAMVGNNSGSNGNNNGDRGSGSGSNNAENDPTSDQTFENMNRAAM